MATPPSAFVTEAEVHAVAATLTTEGAYPSVLAVRRRLGNRGSATTLSKHLRSWREGPGRVAIAQVIAPPEGGPQDPEIEALLHLHPRVVDKLRAQVEGRFRAQITALEQTLASVRDEADAAAAALATAEGVRTAAEGQAAAAIAQVGQLAQELAAMRQQAATAEAAAAAARQAEAARIAGLERDLGVAQGARRQLEATCGERDADLARLRADLAAAQAALREAERRIDADLAQLAALRDLHGAATAEIAGLREQAQAARAAADHAAGERTRLAAQVADLVRAAPAAQDLATAVRQLAAQADLQHRRLRAITLRAARRGAHPPTRKATP